MGAMTVQQVGDGFTDCARIAAAWANVGFYVKINPDAFLLRRIEKRRQRAVRERIFPPPGHADGSDPCLPELPHVFPERGRVIHAVTTQGGIEIGPDVLTAWVRFGGTTPCGDGMIPVIVSAIGLWIPKPRIVKGVNPSVYPGDPGFGFGIIRGLFGQFPPIDNCG
jgi:hypothetical protein